MFTLRVTNAKAAAAAATSASHKNSNDKIVFGIKCTAFQVGKRIDKRIILDVFKVVDVRKVCMRIRQNNTDGWRLFLLLFNSYSVVDTILVCLCGGEIFVCIESNRKDVCIQCSLSDTWKALPSDFHSFIHSFRRFPLFFHSWTHNTNGNCLCISLSFQFSSVRFSFNQWKAVFWQIFTPAHGSRQRCRQYRLYTHCVCIGL